MKINISKSSLLLILYSILLIYSYIFINSYNIALLASLANFILFFWTYLLILKNEKYSNLNKDIIRIFKIFYLYISLIMVIPFAIPILNNEFYPIIYFYLDIILSIIILTISLYLFLFSLNQKISNKLIYLLIIIFISIIIIFINYYQFFLNQSIINTNTILYIKKNYIIKLISILLLLLFWTRYYKKYFILSEYLSLIIFLFMLSNILEALHYIAFQYKFEIFLYSQFLGILLNLTMALVWLIRYHYLQSDIGKKNEQYLANFQYLDGLVAKPKAGLMQKIIAKISINYIILLFSVLIISIFFLYLGKLVNLYLFLNTVFILITTFFAVFFGFSSIKRDWQNQFGFLWKNKSKSN